MDTNIAQKIARAFVHGLAFAKGMATLAQDAKAKMEEGDKWITIGAEPGDDGKKHGGRHVLISGTGEVKAGLSKSAQGKPLGEAIKDLKDKAESKKAESKKAESKKAESKSKTKSKKAETTSAGALTKQGSSLAQLAEREYDKVLTSLKNDVGSINTDPTFPAGIKKYEAVQLKSILRDLKIKLSDAHNDLSIIKDMVSKAVKDGNFNQQGVSSVWLAIKRLKERAAYVVNRTYSETAGTDRNNTRGMKETAETLGSLSNEASGIRHDANRLKEEVRGSIAQFEREQTESAPETHTYSAKELDSMKQKQEGRAKAKKQNAELNRKLKEGEKAGNIQFPRNEFRERAKVYTEQANQVINDDLKPSVDKLGSAIRKNTDNARMPQSTLDDLNDIHNLAKQIGPMASKLNKYNEKYAAEHDDPSNYVISNYGAATKGTAETVASLARRAAAMSNQLTAPDDERDYSEGRAKQEIRDILEEMRGLHGDLLKKTHHAATAFNTSKPSNSESDRVDAMYAQKGSKPKQRIIN